VQGKIGTAELAEHAGAALLKILDKGQSIPGGCIYRARAELDTEAASFAVIFINLDFTYFPGHSLLNSLL
jgi:hypothetical protein